MFPDHLPCVDITWHVEDKTPDPIPEGGWLCLPFNVEGPSFRVGRIGGTIDPTKDIIFGASKDILCADQFDYLLINDTVWDRKMTAVTAKDADGKILKIYDRKVNDSSRGGKREATETVVAYDGKEWDFNAWLAECPDLIGKEFTVDRDYYFVMGDHRNNSNDSRAVGAIERDMIIGHVRRVLYPFNSWRGVE